MQRSYVLNKDNKEIMVDFGNMYDKSNYATEVVSTIDKNNNVHVESTRYMGKSKNWGKEEINSYLASLFGVCENED